MAEYTVVPCPRPQKLPQKVTTSVSFLKSDAFQNSPNCVAFTKKLSKDLPKMSQSGHTIPNHQLRFMEMLIYILDLSTPMPRQAGTANPSFLQDLASQTSGRGPSLSATVTEAATSTRLRCPSGWPRLIHKTSSRGTTLMLKCSLLKMLNLALPGAQRL